MAQGDTLGVVMQSDIGSGASGGIAAQAQISGVFSATATYAVGDYVVYNSLLYRCTTAHSGAWDASHFEQVTIGGEVQTLNTDIVAKAPLASPALTGNPTAPTQAASTNNTRIATTSFVQREFGTTVAPLFSATANYSVGQYCIYSGLLYRCTTAHSGAWNAAHFTQVTIGGEVQTLNTDMAALPNLYAPSGYGLGSTAYELTAQDDLNNLVYGGYYFAAGNIVPESKNNPLYEYGLESRGFFLEVQPGRLTSQCKQKLTIYPSNGDGDGTGIMVRYCRSGTFTPWEWINPLFIDSDTIEYRTTEKWRSKSVYTRCVNFMDFSTIGEKSTTVAIPNIDRIIRIGGAMNAAGGYGPLAHYRYLQGVWINSSGQIVFNITQGVQGAGCVPVIYYSKTT